MSRGIYEVGPVTKFKDPESFIEAKIEMLEEHFKITLDADDIIRLKKYKTEVDINAAVRSIIEKHWR